MSEVIVSRVDHPDADENDHVFQNSQEPPAYAAVRFEGPGGQDVAVLGPLNKAQLDLHFSERREFRMRTDEEQSTEDARPYPARIVAGDIWIAGDYPGGQPRAAELLAQFVLGAAEPEQS